MKMQSPRRGTFYKFVTENRAELPVAAQGRKGRFLDIVQASTAATFAGAGLAKPVDTIAIKL